MNVMSVRELGEARARIAMISFELEFVDCISQEDLLRYELSVIENKLLDSIKTLQRRRMYLVN